MDYTLLKTPKLAIMYLYPQPVNCLSHFRRGNFQLSGDGEGLWAIYIPILGRFQNLGLDGVHGRWNHTGQFILSGGYLWWGNTDITQV